MDLDLIDSSDAVFGQLEHLGLLIVRSSEMDPHEDLGYQEYPFPQVFLRSLTW